LTAPEVIGRAAKLAGLVDTDRPVAAAEVPVLVGDVPRLRARFGLS
jgi:hypothetical protein